MYLTAMTHRQELFDLTLRWLNDTFDSDDGKNITKIFTYESGISSLIFEWLLELLSKIFATTLQTKRVRTKYELRDQIISTIGLRGARYDELSESFRKKPEYFFPRLPIDATVFTDSTSRLVAIARIKRLSRVAEKVSFRLAEALFHEIQEADPSIAGMRGQPTVRTASEFISSEKKVQNDYKHVEDSIVQSLRNKQLHIDPVALTINDILGFKIIASPAILARAQHLFTDEPGITIAEVQQHCGNYNAINLLLDIELPPPAILTARLANMDWAMAGPRGLDPGDIRSGISKYVTSGTETIRIEIILTTPEELMESEFGRSIHELRILQLRGRQAYCGPLAQNAEYLIEYLLALASSPTVSISEIPIKLYGRYLPEEISTMKCALYGNTVDGGLLSTFCLQQNCKGNFCLTNSAHGSSEYKIT